MKSRTRAAISPEVGCISLGRAGTRANLVEQNQPSLPVQIPEPLNKHYITFLLSILIRKLWVRERPSTLFSRWGEGLWRSRDLPSAMVEASATPLCLSDCPLNTPRPFTLKAVIPQCTGSLSCGPANGTACCPRHTISPQPASPSSLGLVGDFSHL